MMRISCCVFLPIAFLLCCTPARAEDLDALNSQLIKLYNAGKYVQAIPIAQQYAEGTKKQFGENSPEYAVGLSNLARLYRAQGRYAGAEPR